MHDVINDTKVHRLHWSSSSDVLDNFSLIVDTWWICYLYYISIHFLITQKIKIKMNVLVNFQNTLNWGINVLILRFLWVHFSPMSYLSYWRTYSTAVKSLSCYHECNIQNHSVKLVWWNFLDFIFYKGRNQHYLRSKVWTLRTSRSCSFSLLYKSFLPHSLALWFHLLA